MSPISFVAARWASVPPILPAPISAILLRAMGPSQTRFQKRRGRRTRPGRGVRLDASPCATGNRSGRGIWAQSGLSRSMARRTGAKLPSGRRDGVGQLQAAVVAAADRPCGRARSRPSPSRRSAFAPRRWPRCRSSMPRLSNQVAAPASAAARPIESAALERRRATIAELEEAAAERRADVERRLARPAEPRARSAPAADQPVERAPASLARRRGGRRGRRRAQGERRAAERPSSWALPSSW